MSELWLIYLIIFCAVLFAVQGAYWVYVEHKVSRDAVNRRLVLASQTTNAKEVLDVLKQERGLTGIDDRYFGRLSKIFVQTGLKLDGQILIAVAFALGVAFFLAFGFVLGYGIIALILAVLCAAVSMFLFLMAVRRRRIAKFSEQLPDAIDVIVRGVKSGYPFKVALSLVAKEMPDPIGTEFGMTSDEINFGSDIGTALDNLYHRVGHDDLPYLIMAIKVQQETGGNLGEILSRLTRLLRERATLRLKVRAITAEGRLSGVFLSVMPFVLFGVITLLKRDYFTGVADHPIMTPALLVALTLLVIGNITIYRMVNFRI